MSLVFLVVPIPCRDLLAGQILRAHRQDVQEGEVGFDAAPVIDNVVCVCAGTGGGGVVCEIARGDDGVRCVQSIALVFLARADKAYVCCRGYE